MQHYRIGDFARYLGVTPDLLKHYEELGLLTPLRSESGYRYYPFNTTSLLLESIRLRNYGLTLREIQEILTEKKVPTSAMETRFQTNMNLLRMETNLNQALIEDYEEFLIWKEPLDNSTFDWSIRWSRPMYFLPHADHEAFLDDERIYALLKDWMGHIPLVKSSIHVLPDGRKLWGLIVEKGKLEKMHLPVNDVVELIPSHKVFYYQFKGKLSLIADEAPSVKANPAFQTIASMNLTPKGDYYRTSLMPCSWEKGIQYQYGYYAVPLQ